MLDVLKTLQTLVNPKRANTASPRQVTQPVKKDEQKNVQKQAVAQNPPKISTQAQEDMQAKLQAMRADMEAEIRISQAKAKEMIIEAKDEAYRIRRETEDELRKKIDTIERREGALEERDKRFGEKEREMAAIREKIDQMHKEQLEKLEAAAHVTHEEAKQIILSEIQFKLKEDIAKEIREAQTEAEETSEEKAKEILIDAMRHAATDYVPEFTVSVVKIPDEDMKGRIIGKEGRNIRAFEAATGVDVDLDEEGVIRLSCFDPVRREIARVTLERLLRDGRVQPGRIEEIVEQVKREIERIMFEEGQKLCHAVGVYNLPAPLVALLGRFKYRFSYGQNMIAHTMEETKIGIALAQEIHADVNIVRLGCLLHDIGKIVMDQEGSHVEIGVALLKKYGVPQKVIDCVAQHHEDIPFSSIESTLVYISDAISGSRPGARYENYEEYLKRLTDLEGIAKSHEGVKECFAFQAGRELRVVVDPGKVDDATATIMARDIKQEIEKKLTYPGQIKVTVVRELRAVEVAK
jgi:ribonucrease Y